MYVYCCGCTFDDCELLDNLKEHDIDVSMYSFDTKEHLEEFLAVREDPNYGNDPNDTEFAAYLTASRTEKS